MRMHIFGSRLLHVEAVCVVQDPIANDPIGDDRRAFWEKAERKPITHLTLGRDTRPMQAFRGLRK